VNRKAANPILLLSESAKTSIIAAAAKAHPNETGGILIGVHTENGQPGVFPLKWPLQLSGEFVYVSES
jgi:hypothetical protein